MRNKIFIILGILVIVFTIVAAFLFENNIRQNSELFGVNVLIAKTTIQEGTVIKSIEQANELFTVRRIVRSNVVDGAIEVNTTGDNQEHDIVYYVKKLLGFYEPQVAPEDLQNLLGKKITTTLYKNQQVLDQYIANDPVEYAGDERLYAIQTSYIDSVGAEISKGDYVDIWVYYNQHSSKAGFCEKVLGPVKIIKLKDSENTEITSSNRKAIPYVVIFKLNEEQIAVLRQKQAEGQLFLTKWGITPTVNANIYTSQGSFQEQINEISGDNGQE